MSTEDKVTNENIQTQGEDALDPIVREREKELLILDAKRREENIKKDTQELFEQVQNYLKSELKTTNEEYKLLEKMNNSVAEKYSAMTAHAQVLVSQMGELKEKYLKFLPYLLKIDEIDATLTEFEKTVIQLDEYTHRLENKFKYLKEAKKLPFKKNISNV